ncbi:sigma-70 family RNA polymerase sigma factor [Hyphomicrobium sp.]|uniref:sigma-70 family RNA polymerase sigma factor n=1 Tax=Hyphomicrobium sp. TaxID=82 RepID=UPI00356150E1
MSDSDKLRQIAGRRDPRAFKQLFEKYAPRVKSLMMRYGADANTAEELAQETLFAVWRKATLYSDEKGSVTTWIFAIARNLRIDKLRREETWVELPDGYDQQPSTDVQPDEVLSDEERRLKMRLALNSLPADQLQVVTLSFIDGRSHSQIAEQLGLPVGTVKSRIRLAYLKLRAVVGTDEQ